MKNSSGQLSDSNWSKDIPSLGFYRKSSKGDDTGWPLKSREKIYGQRTESWVVVGWCALTGLLVLTEHVFFNSMFSDVTLVS